MQPSLALSHLPPASVTPPRTRPREGRSVLCAAPAWWMQNGRRGRTGRASRGRRGRPPRRGQVVGRRSRSTPPIRPRPATTTSRPEAGRRPGCCRLTACQSTVLHGVVGVVPVACERGASSSADARPHRLVGVGSTVGTRAAWLLPPRYSSKAEALEGGISHARAVCVSIVEVMFRRAGPWCGEREKGAL